MSTESPGERSKKPGANEGLDNGSEATEVGADSHSLDNEILLSKIMIEAKQALKAARASVNGRQSQVQKIFDECQKLKGMSAKFGYELISQIGQSLCDFISQISETMDAELNVIHHHLAAMEAVLRKRVKGRDSPTAGKIMAKLEHMTMSFHG